MVRRLMSVLGVTIVAVLVWTAGSAVAAPGARLKQFKVPTADSQPRAITNGPDGNRWFTEGTEFTGAPAKIARITPWMQRATPGSPSPTPAVSAGSTRSPGR
jgi:hypothetical protein